MAAGLNNANSTANTANNTANTANTNATNAVSTANTANTNANNAVSTANTANTNATNAVNTANSASTKADTATSTANTAKSTADTAKSTADTAKSTADAANSAASKAQTTANTANTTATAAKNAIDNLEVGGRNLLIGTATATGDVASGSGTLVENLDLYGGLAGVKTNVAWSQRTFNLKAVAARNGFKVGDKLVCSVYIKSDAEVAARVSCHRTTGTGNISGSTKVYSDAVITPT